MDSDFKTALVQATKTYDADLLRPALVRRTMYTFALAEDPATFVALVNGAIPNAIAWNNTIFWLDEADTTTPGDGATVVRTFDDYCYKVEDIDMRVRSVLSFTTTTPPGSPSVGDSYLVPAGATGTWSSHQDDIATYTPRGWVFEVPVLGRQLQDEEVDGMLRYSATGWVYGYGTQAFDDESVPLSASLGWGERVIVENQSTTTPPTATKGLRYIVGSAATGAWLGRDKQIAICQVAGTWTFYAPSNGWAAFDKDLGIDLTYNGSAWVSAGGAWVGYVSQFTQSMALSSLSGSTAYNYSGSTPPTTTSRVVKETSYQPQYAAKRVGAKLRFTHNAAFRLAVSGTAASVSGSVCIALFRDSEANAIAWEPLSSFEYLARTSGANVNGSALTQFEITASDTSQHTYAFGFTGAGASPNRFDVDSLTRVTISIEEAA